MDLGRQPEGGQQHDLAGGQLGGVHVAADVAGQRLLGPAPVGQGRGPELQPPGRGGEAAADGAVDHHPGGPAALAVRGRGAGRHDVGAVRSGGTGVDAPGRGDGQVGEFAGRDLAVVQRALAAADLEGPVAPHVLQRGQALRRGPFGQAGHRVLEHPAVVLIHGQLLAGPGPGLVVAPDAHRAVRVDPPGQLGPPLVLLPHLARVDLAGVGDLLAEPLAGRAQHRLPEADPLPVVLLVGVRVVPFGAVAHRQHVVGEVGRLVPGRGQRHEAADLGLVGEHLHPGQPVGVGPHRVVDPDEVGVELAPAVFEEVRQQEAQLVLG